MFCSGRAIGIRARNAGKTGLESKTPLARRPDNLHFVEREAGGAVVSGELCAVLFDDEGASIEAGALWQRLTEEAPSVVDAGTKEDFAAALDRCLDAAARDDLEGVLALTAAFERLTTMISQGASAPRK